MPGRQLQEKSAAAMRLAVFTNQFPARTSSFFARDMRALLEAGVEMDIFPLYPLDPSLWGAVPEILPPEILPPERVHHISPAAALGGPSRGRLQQLPGFGRDVLAIQRSAIRFGPDCCLKSTYAAAKAWGWARQFPGGTFDHVLAYWGNYAATSAYLYHRLTDPTVPFSMFAHARMDLYQKQVYLEEKLGYADNVFLVCEYNRAYLRTRYPRLFPRLEAHIHIHHLGLELDSIPFTPGPRPPDLVLAVGRLERLKGHHCLLDAVRMLRDRGVRVRAEFAGGGEEEAALRRQAQQLGLEEQVRFLGWLDLKEVMDAMRSATVLVHPSVRPDAMPTVVKEAIAVGTPVIASDLAGIPEMLDGGRCGVLTPAGDVAGLAAAIERLLGDESLRAHYAALGRRHAEERFDLWRNGRQLARRLRTTQRRNEPTNGQG